MRIVLFLFGLFFHLQGYSQNISVSNFRLLESDLTANTAGTMEKDQNGEIAALIKVVTTQTGFTFDGGALGIVKTIQKPSEVWVYVPRRLKKITISHPQLGVLRDYYLDIPIEAARTYEMILTSGTIQTVIHQDAGAQYLVLTIEPQNANVFIDDKEVNTNNGVVSKLLAYGNHSYRVSAPLYHAEAGIINIGKEKYQKTISLAPDHGIALIKTEPEDGADVFIDNETESIGYTPVRTRKLQTGEHLIKVRKNGYLSKEMKMNVKGDGTTQEITIPLEANFGTLVVSLPEKCKLFVNEVEKDPNVWNGRLEEGIYVLEARRPSHRSTSINVEIKVGEQKSVSMPSPIPIVGSLDISTEPINARVYLDGEELGEAPSIFNNVLVGKHDLSLYLEGYENVHQEISINENEISKYSFLLKKASSSIHRTDKRVNEKGFVSDRTSTYNYISVDGSEFRANMVPHLSKGWHDIVVRYRNENELRERINVTQDDPLLIISFSKRRITVVSNNEDVSMNPDTRNNNSFNIKNNVVFQNDRPRKYVYIAFNGGEFSVNKEFFLPEGWYTIAVRCEGEEEIRDRIKIDKGMNNFRISFNNRKIYSN